MLQSNEALGYRCKYKFRNNVLQYKALACENACAAPSLESLRSRIDSLVEFCISSLWYPCQDSLCSLCSCLAPALLKSHDDGGLALTGSTTSIHCDVLLSTNSPPIRFFVLPPVALVPFHSAEIFSACVRAVELRAARGGLEAAVANERVRTMRKRAIALECMTRRECARDGSVRSVPLRVCTRYAGLYTPVRITGRPDGCHGS